MPKTCPHGGRLPLIGCTALLAACGMATAHLTEGTAGSTAIMLDRAIAETDHTAPFVGERALATRLEATLDVADLTNRERLARSWLRIGKTAAAVAFYRHLENGRAADTSSDVPTDAYAHAYTTALLRLAAESNCLAHHNCDSCVYPIVSAAQHRNPDPARRAAARLRRALDEQPDRATTRWLYNLVHQTLGQYPDHVAPQWRVEVPVDPIVASLPPFVDVAATHGVGVADVAGGCVFDDFDGDSWPDLLTSSMYPHGGTGGQLRLFHNLGHGRGFEEVTDGAGLTGIRGGLNLTHADYDNDGDLDVFVLRGAWKQRHGRWPNTLLHNRGDGTFADVTVEAGMLAFQPTQVGAWGDYDGDGYLDLFVGNETGVPALMPDAISQWFADFFIGLDDAFQPTRAGHLYHNNGDGTFTDVLDDTNIELWGWIKGATWGDYDDDGDLDLFVSRFAKPDLLYRNDGDGAFEDVTEQAGVGGQLLSFATWFWDFDDDADLDLFVAGYPYPAFELPDDEPMDLQWSAEHELVELLGGRVADDKAARASLYRNNGDGTFLNIARQVGVDAVMSTMGANYEDIDGDGHLDLLLGTGAPDFDYLVPNRMFLQRDGRFVDASIPLRVGHLQKGHSIAFADFDGDGDQDAYVVLGGAHLADEFPNALLRNPGFGENRQITFELQGTVSNRCALHARIALEVESADGTRRTLHRMVSGGGSFGSSDLTQELGVGEATNVVSLRVHWPTAKPGAQRSEAFDTSALQIGGRYRIRESTGTPIELTRR